MIYGIKGRTTFNIPTTADIDELALKLRQVDIDELHAITDMSIHETIRLSVERSHPDFQYAVRVDGELVCLFGCTTSGNPWLLCTDKMHRYSKRLTRDTRRVVRMMLNKWPILTNIIDVRNRITIRWLKTIGFQFKDTFEIKPGLPVINFEMRATNERGIS